MDSFPYDSWEQAQEAAGDEAYSTFATGGDFITMLFVLVMIAVFLVAMVAWVQTEKAKLEGQAERLRIAGDGEV